jgi:hypothetical protein
MYVEWEGSMCRSFWQWVLLLSFSCCPCPVVIRFFIKLEANGINFLGREADGSKKSREQQYNQWEP